MNRDLYDLGLATRRKVLGDAHVERGALNNGVTRDKIREVLMQAAFYCGGPAALESFRLAAEVFAQVEAEASE